MAFTASAVSRAYVTDKFNETANLPFSDTWKLALYNNTGTPDKDATSALYAYNAATSAWVTANEVTDATNWPAGGKTISGLAGTNPASGVYMVNCSNVASGGNVTLAGFFGGFVYDNTATTPVAKQGMSHHYFGGTQTVTANPFTAIPDPLGLWRGSV